MPSRRAIAVAALSMQACARPFDLGDLCADDGVTCGTLDVPSDREDPASATLAIQYAVLHATGEASDVAFTMFNGGPSSSSIAAFGPMMLGPLGKPVLEHHDVVLIDQRGIPYSEPDLACPELDDTYRDLVEMDLDYAGREATRLEAILACRDRLAADGIDLTDFESVETARDVAAVMADLGIDRYDVWGVSYGTILAQHVLREDPDHVRAAILDSVAPLGVNILAESPRSASLAWQAISDDCDADPDCHGTFPDTASALKGLLADLEQDPADMESVNPYDGSPWRWTLDGDALAQIAAGSSLQQVPQYLPWYVAQLADGRLKLLEGGGVTDLLYDPTSIDLWTYTFRCTEQADYDVAALPSEGLWPEMEHAFVPVLAAAQEACEPLGLQPLPAEARAPVPFDGPALLFVGRYDPTTPPWMAEHLAASWPGATVHEVPGTGHIASLTPCAFQMIGAFVDDPTSDPDDACLAPYDTFRHTGGCDTGASGVHGALSVALIALVGARRARYSRGDAAATSAGLAASNG